MSYRVSFQPVALEDYKEGLLWYLERSERAAEGFVAAIQETIRNISKNPLQYRNSHSHFREVSLKKYPFNIVYFTDEDRKMVVVSAVYHHKRDPGKKYNR